MPIIREQFTGGQVTDLVEALKPIIPVTKYERLKTLLAIPDFNVSLKITDLIKLVIIKWTSGVEWATETSATKTAINKAISDSGFTKI